MIEWNVVIKWNFKNDMTLHKYTDYVYCYGKLRLMKFRLQIERERILNCKLGIFLT